MFFEKSITVRLKIEDLDKIEGLVKLNPDKYENPSHFVRCGAIKLINEELEK